MTIRVLIADDHPLFRYGLHAVLSTTGDICLVGEAADGATAVTRAIELGADVVLMDLHMPGTSGIDGIRSLALKAPQIGVLVLTMLDNDESLFSAVRAGARGYLVKGADPEQIARAIKAVAAGDVLFGAGIAQRALAYFAAAAVGSRAARPFPELTDREMEVLQTLAEGLNNNDIARRLHVSEKTVRNHVSHIFTRLQVSDRAQAIVRAHEAGLGPPTAG